MKKFIVFVLMLIVSVSIGTTVYYFVRDNEELSIDCESVVYINAGESFEISAVLKNAKIGNSVEVTSLNEEVLSRDPGMDNPVVESKAFYAEKGGAAILEVKTQKGSISTVYITVYVGDGGESTPYYIDSEDDLLKIGTESFSSSANYLLLKDIALSGPITPILNGSEFTGSLNGNGFTISGLKIVEDNSISLAGLFSRIGSTGVVTNLNVTNVNINGSYEGVGAICAINEGTISRCNITSGEIVNTKVGENETAYVSTGGVCGIVRYSDSSVGRIDRCYSNINVTGTNYVGGLSGKNEGGIVINSYVNLGKNGMIKTTASKSNIGGLVGLNIYLNKDEILRISTIKNCYVYGNVVQEDGTEDVMRADLVGYSVDASKDSLNNLMGVYAVNSTNTINYSLTESISNDKSKIYNGRGVYSKMEFIQETDKIQKVNSAALKSFLPNQLDETKVVTEADLVMWDFVNVWLVNEEDGLPMLNKNGADVPDELDKKSDFSKISSEEDLERVRRAINKEYSETDTLLKDISKITYFYLDKDITLTKDFTPIGTSKNPFKGTFEGNGKKIIGLNVSDVVIDGLTTEKYAGLFGEISKNSVVQNLTIVDAKTSEKALYAGAVAAQNNGVIKNCVVTIEEIEDEVSKKDKARNDILATYAVGGVCGRNYGTIESCSVDGVTVQLKGDENAERYAGGICGINGQNRNNVIATVQNCKLIYSVVHDNVEKTGFDSNHNYDLWKNIESARGHIGGISGANYYLITSNYVFDSILETNIYNHKTEVGGIAAITNSENLKNSQTGEITNNKIIGSSITGYVCAGLVCEQYGYVYFNQIGSSSDETYTYYDEDEGMDKEKRYELLITGNEVAGLVNRIYANGRLNNCFVSAHIAGTQLNISNLAGICNLADYVSYWRVILFGLLPEACEYGEFTQIFSTCTFDTSINTEWEKGYWGGKYNHWHQIRYDCTQDYRKEDWMLWTNRDTGFGNNIIWEDTQGHTSGIQGVFYDDSGDGGQYDVIYGSRMQNVGGVSTEEATLSGESYDSMVAKLENYGFSQNNWAFEPTCYPRLINVPQISEIA